VTSIRTSRSERPPQLVSLPDLVALHIRYLNHLHPKPVAALIKPEEIPSLKMLTVSGEFWHQRSTIPGSFKFCTSPPRSSCTGSTDANASTSGSKSIRDSRVGIEQVSKTTIKLARQVSRSVSAWATHHPESSGTPNTVVTVSTSTVRVRACILIRRTCLAAGPTDIFMGSSSTPSACEAWRCNSCECVLQTSLYSCYMKIIVLMQVQSYRGKYERSGTRTHQEIYPGLQHQSCLRP